METENNDLNVKVHDDVKSQAVFGKPKDPQNLGERNSDNPNRAERRRREAVARRQR